MFGEKFLKALRDRQLASVLSIEKVLSSWCISMLRMHLNGSQSKRQKRGFATRHHGISKAEGSCGLLSNVTGMKLFGVVVFFFRSTCFARVYLGFAFLHQCVNDHALPMWAGAFLYIQTGVEDLSTLQHRSYVAWFWSNFKRQIRQQLKFTSHDFHVTHAISAGDLVIWVLSFTHRHIIEVEELRYIKIHTIHFWRHLAQT